ncbi:Crp/Fnr family transcriptional regulator [Variovorax sp. VNK109]|uniref:Crp/Fnr family transcriptional regulator n=1 Tax=Variovorax sp. VNK109 TaxID=3400919 RepID=UPI003C093EB0
MTVLHASSPVTKTAPRITRNLLRNRSIGELSNAERDILETAISETRTFRAGNTVVRHGVEVSISTLLIDGLMSRHIDTRDGKRHLVGVHLPGDFVDLHAYALRKLDHDVGALTDITVGLIPHEELDRILVDHPGITKRLWFLSLLDAAMHRQWLYRVSGLNALARVAHFFCEMNARMLAIDAADESGFSLPLTQLEIGEVCSLTNVHVCRVLRQLRELGLCTFRSSRVEISNLKGLVAAGNFQPDYLYLSERVARRATGGA